MLENELQDAELAGRHLEVRRAELLAPGAGLRIERHADEDVPTIPRTSPSRLTPLDASSSSPDAILSRHSESLAARRSDGDQW